MVQPAPDEALVLWVTAGGMALATLAFVAMGRGETDARRREYYVIASFATTVAFLAYFALATGFGIVEVSVAGETLAVYWARYADWLVTTPLLLLALALLAGADRATVATLLGLDVAWVATGLAGALATEGATVRIAWWLVSSALYVALLYVLVGQLSRRAARRPEAVAATFATLRNLILVAWTGYPVVWILGPGSTLGVVGLPVQTGVYAVLDLLAKVGFGLVLLRSRSVLDMAARPTDAAAVE